jgi:PAS domain S-box-containing protein
MVLRVSRIHALMITSPSPDGKWNERSSAPERARPQTDSMFQILFERSGDAIWLYEPQTGVFVDCNQAAVALLGAGSRERLLQARPEDISPPFQPDGSSSKDKAAEVTALTAQLGGYRFEWTARRMDGQDIPLEVLCTPIPVNGRDLYVVVSRDITERKRAEATLRDSQRLLASIADNIFEAIYRSGPGHELIFVNRAYLELFGYESLADLQALPRDRLYADPKSRMRLLEMLLRDDSFNDQEVEYLRKDGTRFWGLTSARIIRDSQTGHASYQVGAITDITSRKRDEAEILRLNQSLELRIAERTSELGASEARFRALVEHAPEAIVVFDGATGRFLFGNAHTCRLYGVTAEELARLTPADVSPEFQPGGRRSTEVAREKMDEALAGGTPVFEWMHRHSSGRLIPTEVRLLRLPSEGNNLLRASITDHTQHKRRELVQRATFEISEAVHTAVDLPTLYERIHHIVLGLMPAQNFYIALLDAKKEMISFAYHVDEVTPAPEPMPMNTGLTSLVLRLAKPMLVGPDMETRKQFSGQEVTFTGLEGASYKESGPHAAIWLGVPLLLQGRPIGVVAVQDYHDPQAYGEEEKQILTFVAGQIALAIERKRDEQARRESEEKFRALFEASGQGVMLHDDKQYLQVNPAAVRMLGYGSAEELLGKHPRDTSPPVQPNGGSSDELAQKYIAKCLSEGSARFEWTGRTAQGVDLPLEVTLTRIEWSGRQVIQACVSDITERKKSEAELLKALAREKELGQLKGNFVSMVSHEFRTPLAIIQSSAEILKDYLEQLAPAERKEQLESIVKNTHRMAGLMEEILVLSRLDAGKLEFQPAVVDFGGFCARVTEEVLAANQNRCPITLSLAALPGQVYADERLLNHIFNNLLCNALKYSEPGVPVAFNVRHEGRNALCVIRDQGIGIPEKDQAWLFNAFQRGANVGDRPGTGLGLVLVKRCADLHGGQVSIESQVGTGTTVTVKLPIFPPAS